MIVEAKDFVGPKSEGYYFGGGSREAIVAALRKLAEAIEDGRALPQKAIVSAEQGLDLFMMTTLSLTYAERERAFTEEERAHIKVDDEAHERALYGSGGFPVEIRKVGE